MTEPRLGVTGGRTEGGSGGVWRGDPEGDGGEGGIRGGDGGGGGIRGGAEGGSGESAMGLTQLDRKSRMHPLHGALTHATAAHAPPHT